MCCSRLLNPGSVELHSGRRRPLHAPREAFWVPESSHAVFQRGLLISHQAWLVHRPTTANPTEGSAIRFKKTAPKASDRFFCLSSPSGSTCVRSGLNQGVEQDESQHAQAHRHVGLEEGLIYFAEVVGFYQLVLVPEHRAYPQHTQVVDPARSA